MLLSFIIKTSYFFIRKLIETFMANNRKLTHMDYDRIRIKDNEHCSLKCQIFYKIPLQRNLLEFRSRLWIETKSLSRL